MTAPTDRPSETCPKSWCTDHTHYCRACGAPVLQRVDGQCVDCYKRDTPAPPQRPSEEPVSADVERITKRLNVFLHNVKSEDKHRAAYALAMSMEAHWPNVLRELQTARETIAELRAEAEKLVAAGQFLAEREKAERIVCPTPPTPTPPAES